jgi:hypothetical protein
MAKHQGMVDGAIASYNNFFDQEGGKAGVVMESNVSNFTRSTTCLVAVRVDAYTRTSTGARTWFVVARPSYVMYPRPEGGFFESFRSLFESVESLSREQRRLDRTRGHGFPEAWMLAGSVRGGQTVV